jgi:ubiquinone biosynthesis protein UbiJ
MLQAIINKCISMDPDLDLSPLQSKWFCVLCTDFPKQINYFTFENNRILFATNPPEKIDISIKASLNALLNFAVNKKYNNIEVQGDIATAQLCERLFSKLDIDWEEELSKHTGDAIAYYALDTLRKLRSYTKNAGLSLSEMVSEYLQEESGILPTKIELDHFMLEVDELRMQVDRLEAKVKMYENN